MVGSSASYRVLTNQHCQENKMLFLKLREVLFLIVVMIVLYVFDIIFNLF